MDAKSIWFSRLFWIGVIEAVYGVLHVGQDIAAGRDPGQEAVLAVVFAILTIALRIRTDQPVELR